MGLSAVEVKTAIEYAIANGGSNSDPVVFEGAAGNIGSVILVLPDLQAAPGTPAYEGPRYIKLQAE
jgi:hypothetical protein